MPRKSKISKLLPEQKRYIESLIRDGRFTLDEMIEKIRGEFPESEDLPSRNGLHRFQQQFDTMTARLREIERMSEVMVGELGEGGGDKAGALLAQAITSLAAHAALSAHDGEPVPIDDIRKLSQAAKNAMETRRISLAERQAIEKATEERVLKEQKSKLETTAKATGMSAESKQVILRDILGIPG